MRSGRSLRPSCPRLARDRDGAVARPSRVARCSTACCGSCGQARRGATCPESGSAHGRRCTPASPRGVGTGSSTTSSLRCRAGSTRPGRSTGSSGAWTAASRAPPGAREAPLKGGASRRTGRSRIGHVPRGHGHEVPPAHGRPRDSPRSQGHGGSGARVEELRRSPERGRDPAERPGKWLRKRGVERVIAQKSNQEGRRGGHKTFDKAKYKQRRGDAEARLRAALPSPPDVAAPGRAGIGRARGIAH